MNYFNTFSQRARVVVEVCTTHHPMASGYWLSRRNANLASARSLISPAALLNRHRRSRGGRAGLTHSPKVPH